MNKRLIVITAHVLMCALGLLMFQITLQFYMPAWIPYACWLPAMFLSGLDVSDIETGKEPEYTAVGWVWGGAWVLYSMFWIHTGGLLSLVGVKP